MIGDLKNYDSKMRAKSALTNRDSIAVRERVADAENNIAQIQSGLWGQSGLGIGQFDVTNLLQRRVNFGGTLDFYDTTGVVLLMSIDFDSGEISITDLVSVSSGTYSEIVISGLGSQIGTLTNTRRITNTGTILNTSGMLSGGSVNNVEIGTSQMIGGSISAIAALTGTTNGLTGTASGITINSGTLNAPVGSINTTAGTANALNIATGTISSSIINTTLISGTVNTIAGTLAGVVVNTGTLASPNITGTMQTAVLAGTAPLTTSGNIQIQTHGGVPCLVINDNGTSVMFLPVGTVV